MEEGVEKRKAHEKRQLRRARIKVSVLLIHPRPLLVCPFVVLLFSSSCPPPVLNEDLLLFPASDPAVTGYVWWKEG